MNKTTLIRRSSGCLLAGAVLALVAPTANADGLYLGVDAGYANADIDGGIFADGSGITDGVDEAILMGGFLGGYQWDSGVFVEAGYQGYAGLTVVLLTERLEIGSWRTAVGYEFQSASRFRLRTKVGAGFWELDATESVLFEGSGAERSQLDGSDLFVELGTEYRFSDSFSAGVALDHSILGDNSATAFKLTFRLRL